MTDDAILVLECLFETIWQFFTSWNIPGTDVTPAVMALFLLSAGVGLRFVLRFLNGDAGLTGSGAVRSWNTYAGWVNRGNGRSMK